MANVELSSAALEMSQVQAAARMLGLDPVALEIRRAEDIAPAFESLKDRADALYVGPNLRMDIPWGGGNVNRASVFAKELVALQPDVWNPADCCAPTGDADNPDCICHGSSQTTR